MTGALAGGSGHPSLEWVFRQARSNSVVGRGPSQRSDGLLLQFHGESRAFTQLALRPESSAMSLSNLFGDVETQPETSEMLDGDGSLEAIKNPLLILFLDADPVISDDQPRTIPRLGDSDFNWLSGAVLHGVRE